MIEGGEGCGEAACDHRERCCLGESQPKDRFGGDGNYRIVFNTRTFPEDLIYPGDVEVEVIYSTLMYLS